MIWYDDNKFELGGRSIDKPPIWTGTSNGQWHRSWLVTLGWRGHRGLGDVVDWRVERGLDMVTWFTLLQLEHGTGRKSPSIIFFLW